MQLELHTDALNEQLAAELKDHKITTEGIPQRVVELILLQTELQEQTQADEKSYWAKMLETVKARGYTNQELEQFLGLKSPDVGRIHFFYDPLKVNGFVLHYRLHQLVSLQTAVEANSPTPSEQQFLLPVVQSEIGLFNFVNAGCFALEQAEKISSMSYRVEDFRATADEVSLSLWQASPFGKGIETYSSSFHRNVLRLIDNRTTCGG